MSDGCGIDWDRFGTDRYLAANYRTVAPADAWLCGALAESWALIATRLGTSISAIDVGTGPNLYTVLAAMPRVRRVTAHDPSAANRRYLEQQKTGLDPTWEKWIKVLAEHDPVYGGVDVVPALSRKLVVRPTNIHALEPRGADAATMFFCAECITGDRALFEAACLRVIDAVAVGGPLLCAFMIGSSGYDTAGLPLPAVPISEADVRALFAPAIAIERLEKVPGGADVREGHDGMLFLFGQVL